MDFIRVIGILENPVDEPRDELHLRLLHPTSGDGGRPHPESRCHHRFPRIKRNHVLVGGDTGLVQRDLRGLARGLRIHQ